MATHHTITIQTFWYFGKTYLFDLWRVLVWWYLIALIVEYFFPTLVTHRIDLDIFLITLVILGIVVVIIPKDSKKS